MDLLQQNDIITLEYQYQVMNSILECYLKQNSMQIYQEAIGDERMEYRATDENGNKEHIGKSILMFIVRLINNLVYRIRSLFKKAKNSRAQKEAEKGNPPKPNPNMIQQAIQNKSIKSSGSLFKVDYTDSQIIINTVGLDCFDLEGLILRLIIDVKPEYLIETNISFQMLNERINIIQHATDRILHQLQSRQKDGNLGFDDSGFKNCLNTSISEPQKFDVLSFTQAFQIGLGNNIEALSEKLDTIQNVLKSNEGITIQGLPEMIKSILNEISQLEMFHKSVVILTNVPYNYGFVDSVQQQQQNPQNKQELPKQSKQFQIPKTREPGKKLTAMIGIHGRAVAADRWNLIMPDANIRAVFDKGTPVSKAITKYFQESHLNLDNIYKFGANFNEQYVALIHLGKGSTIFSKLKDDDLKKNVDSYHLCRDGSGRSIPYALILFIDRNNLVEGAIPDFLSDEIVADQLYHLLTDVVGEKTPVPYDLDNKPQKQHWMNMNLPSPNMTDQKIELTINEHQKQSNDFDMAMDEVIHGSGSETNPIITKGLYAWGRCSR